MRLRLAGVRVPWRSAPFLGVIHCEVWVLTGDKVDTAISIAMSCKLLTSEMNNFVIDQDTDRPPLDGLFRVSGVRFEDPGDPGGRLGGGSARVDHRRTGKSC